MSKWEPATPAGVKRAADPLARAWQGANERARASLLIASLTGTGKRLVQFCVIPQPGGDDEGYRRESLALDKPGLSRTLA